MEAIDALAKSRDIQLENHRQYQGAVMRFLTGRLLVTLLAAGVLATYDLADERAGDRGAAFQRWYDSAFTPRMVDFDNRFRYGDFRQRTEDARKRISRFVTPAIMDEAMKAAYGRWEEPRLARAFYYFKVNDYKIDIFNYPTITNFLADLEALKNQPMSEARAHIAEMIKARNLYVDHPGLEKESVALLAAARTVAEFQQSFGALAAAARARAESKFADQLDAWRAIDRLDANWYAWRYALWRSLPDASFEDFQRSLKDLGGDGMSYLATLKDDELFGDAIRKIQQAVQRAEKERKSQSQATLSFASISFPLSKRLALLVFPFLFVASTLMTGMLRLRARVALIWVAAIEQKIRRQVTAAIPTVSEEVLNPDRVWHYAGRGHWAALFDNNPSLFPEALYSLLSWAIAAYLAYLPWRGLQASAAAGTIGLSGMLVAWTAALLLMRLRIERLVIARTLDATGERTKVASVEQPPKISATGGEA
jgi:hypothetical protein